MADKEPDPALQFLEKDYELKVAYLTNHFTRMWQRFNFFVVFEGLALTALFTAMGSGAALVRNGTLISAFGLAASLCWYAFGAQDKYLVEVYRSHVEQAGAVIAQSLGLEHYI